MWLHSSGILWQCLLERHSLELMQCGGVPYQLDRLWGHVHLPIGLHWLGHVVKRCMEQHMQRCAVVVCGTSGFM